MALFGGVKEHFGIDIGTNAVRIVKLSGSPGSYFLESFGSAPIPAGLSESDSKLDQEKLAKIINDLLVQSGISTKAAVSAIPGTSVFTAVVKLPPMSQSELIKAINYQAEQNIPLKIEEIKYDWQVIKQDPVNKELTVMIIAATRNKVQSLVDLFSYAGIELVALETAAVAFTRSLTNSTSGTVMILDIGSRTTEIAIAENGVLIQTRSFPLAGLAMTRAVSKNLGLDLDQAEQFKIKFGLAQDKLEGQVYKAIEPTLKSIADEAIRSLNFYSEQFNNRVTRIILTGGSSRLLFINEYLKTILPEVEIFIGNPWVNISFQPNFNDKINQVAPEFATAVGLAMRN